MRPRPGGLSCRQVGKALQAFLDGEIDDPDRRARLQTHLDACRDCGLEADTYRRLTASLHQRAGAIDPVALDRLRSFGARLGADDPPDG